MHVGVLLEESNAVPDGADSAGHAEAWGHRGRHIAGDGQQVAQLGQDILQAAAQAVGREVAVVVAGVVAGIERPSSRDSGANNAVASGDLALNTGSFTIDNLELTFGVKATLGVGPVVTALLTASGEATVEVKLTLSQRNA
jgi:hypothetical protein